MTESEDIGQGVMLKKTGVICLEHLYAIIPASIVINYNMCIYHTAQLHPRMTINKTTVNHIFCAAFLQVG